MTATRRTNGLLPTLLGLIAAPACSSAAELDDLDDATKEIVDNLHDAGFDDEQIELREDGVVVIEGDIVVGLEASRELASDGDAFRHYRTSNLVSHTVRRICVDGRALGGVLGTALDAALANFNRIDLRFRMVRTSGAVAGCDATITAHTSAGEGGEAGFPSGGMPFSWMWIGSDVAHDGLAVATHVITHELGHCIGLRHSDYFDRSISCGGAMENEGWAGVGAAHIPGTPTGATANSSVMNACYHGGSTGVWTADDRYALRYLYMEGVEDILWQHDNGQVHYWQMHPGAVTGFVDVSIPVAPDWRLLGSGDLDGDGIDDIVWQHDNGQIHFWHMWAGQPTSFHDVLTPVDASWHARGIGDVDGDGTDDIVWQHDNGQVHFWRMREGTPVGFIDVSSPVGPEWHLRGVGDLDGTGIDDIVWQHDSGLVHYWRMQGGVPVGYVDIWTAIAVGNQIEAIGDITRDGTDDIVWRDASGQVSYWGVQNGAVASGGNLLTPVSLDWDLVAVGGIDG